MQSTRELATTKYIKRDNAVSLAQNQLCCFCTGVPRHIPSQSKIARSRELATTKYIKRDNAVSVRKIVSAILREPRRMSIAICNRHANLRVRNYSFHAQHKETDRCKTYPFLVWSGKRDSNSRHLPWQGNALPLSHSRITFNKWWEQQGSNL